MDFCNAALRLSSWNGDVISWFAGLWNGETQVTFLLCGSPLCPAIQGIEFSLGSLWAVRGQPQDDGAVSLTDKDEKT